jgi:alanine racemase
LGDTLEVSPTHPTWMEIDPSALATNLAEIRRRVRPGVKVIASVKANAYGHGIIPVARSLEAAGVDMLATGAFAEAQAVRAAGVETPIVMLAGALPEGIAALVAAGFMLTVYDRAGIRAAASAASDEPAKLFLKVDCGMGRLGVSLADAPGLVDFIAGMDGVVLEGVYTHLSFKNADGMAYARERLELFYDLLRVLHQAGHEIPITQALASSALMVGWTDDCTAICPGHVLYGMPSVAPELAPLEGFTPVLGAIRSRVIGMSDHGNDGLRGRGAYHANRRERRTVVVPCGLNDGNRSAVAGQTAEALFRGRRLTVLGGSLEHLVIEVPEDVEIGIGDTVTIVGGEGAARIGIAEYARWQGGSPIECMLSLSARMPVVATEQVNLENGDLT